MNNKQQRRIELEAPPPDLRDLTLWARIAERERALGPLPRSRPWDSARVASPQSSTLRPGGGSLAELDAARQQRTIHLLIKPDNLMCYQQYHVVFVPKRRRKAIFGQARRPLGTIFHALARQKECEIIEGHLMPDHVHVCIAIPPKHPVASVIGFLKGKRAIAIARLCGKERNFAGKHFWARSARHLIPWPNRL